MTFAKTGDNSWDVSAAMDGNALALSTTMATFDTNSNLPSPSTISLSGCTPPGADPIAIDIELAGSATIVQFSGGSTAESFDQDGNAIGFLSDFSIAENDTISGQFSDGETKVPAMVATATFNSPSGLIRNGKTHFQASTKSGAPLIGGPGSGSRGPVAGGALEMSNVDLAQEFTNLIIAQRGFQANSRVITASDEVLSDLVNLKR